VVWSSFYWTAFILCWAFLPFLMSYVQTGEFTVQAKMRWALRDNLKYYGLVGVLGLFFLVYLWWNNAFAQ